MPTPIAMMAPTSNAADSRRPESPASERAAVARRVCRRLLRFERDRRHESIALARQRLDEARMFCRIAQGVSQVVDRLVQPAIEVHERPGRPQPTRQFFPCDEFARLLQQGQQELERLFAKRRSPPGVWSVHRSERRG